MGGFSGSDPVVNGTGLARLVSEGKLRYVLLGGGGPGNQSSNVSAWVTSTCRTVPGMSASSEAGDGARGGFGPGGGGTLYDCAGA